MKWKIIATQMDVKLKCHPSFIVQDLIWKHYRPGQEVDKRPTIEYIATAFVSVSCVALKEGRPLPTLADDSEEGE